MLRRPPVLTALLLLGLAGSCRLPAADAPGADAAGGVLFHNGRIWPGRVQLDGSPEPAVEALLAIRGLVVATGDLAALEREFDLSRVERLDLGGGSAIPGLQDSHGDLAGLGDRLLPSSGVPDSDEPDPDQPDPGQPDESEGFQRRVLAAQGALLALGVTGVHDMGRSAEELLAYRGLDDRGELRLRVTAYARGDESAEPTAYSAVAYAGDRFACAGVLLRADASESPGDLLLKPAGLLGLLRAAHLAGLQPATAASGEDAVRMVLDAYAALGARDASFVARRPRIELAERVAPADWPRFNGLAVVPSVRPGVGPGAALAGPVAPLALSAGAGLSAEDPDPLLAMYVAVTGEPYGGIRLTPAQALEGLTWGAAYAVHQERRVGRLLPGYAADLTVFDRDVVSLAAADPEQLLEARCVLTVIDGRVEYDAR